MYDELINKLNHCANEVFCNKCPYSPDCAGEKTIIREAADAIEELQKQLQKSEVDNINLTGWLAEEHAKLDRAEIENIKLKEEFAKYRGKHRWIPVTERLPKENGFYLCLYKHKASGGVAMDEGLSILQWINNKWGINDIYLVTHWMPLPDAPEGEE